MEKKSPQSNSKENEYSWQGRQFSQEVVTVSDKGRRSKGLILEPSETAHFEVFSDEGARLGGENSAPRPLNYFLLSVGFCALTQLHRYGEMLKVNIKNAKVTVRSGFRTDGSVLRGTIQASTVDFEVDFDVESDDAPDKISKCIEAAEAGCFVMQTIQNPTEITRKITLNGKILESPPKA